MAEPGDGGEDDFSSLLAPRFRKSGAAASSTPAAPAVETPEATPDDAAAPHDAPPQSVAPAPVPDDLPSVPTAAPPPSAAPITAEAATAIVGNERFLPIAEAVIVPVSEPGPLRIFAPVGTAVHVIEAGRIADTDHHIAGEITIRVDGDRFYRYRRLLPSSIVVDPGEHVSPGTVIGVVGESVDEDPPCLVVGLQSGAGEWSDLHRILVGLPDPGELGLSLTTERGTWVDPLTADTSSGASSDPAGDPR